ncbi:MAG: T9SS type A sorting domain-containing protein [Bacteroidota bacterium]
MNILDDIALDSTKTVGTSLNIRFNMKENLAKATLIEPELLDFLPIQQFADSIDPANLGKIMEASTMINSRMTSTDSTLFREKLEEINAGVLPENLIKETYLLLSKNLGLKDSIYTSTEIQRLRQIAGYCPYTKGNAVITARSILASLDPLDKFYLNACEQSFSVNGSRVAPLDADDEEDLRINDKKEIKSSKITFSINPNPSSDKINLLFNEKISLKNSAQILTVEGRQIVEVSLSNNLVIDVSSLSNGLYYIKVYLQDNSGFLVAKFIVNK